MSSDTPTKPRRKSLSYGGSSNDLSVSNVAKRHHTLRSGSSSPLKETKKTPKLKPIREKSTSRKPRVAPEHLLTPHDFVLAFERYFLKSESNLNPLSSDHLDILTAKETVKLKHKPKKKPSIGMGLFEEPGMSSPSQSINLDGWNNLDLAKKERRVFEIMRKRSDITEQLKQIALEAFPVPLNFSVCFAIIMPLEMILI